METKILAEKAPPPARVVPMWPNRKMKRVGDVAFRRLSKGTKVPGRVKQLLGDERLARLRKLAVDAKMAAEAKLGLAA